jgi:hypothetical protein
LWLIVVDCGCEELVLNFDTETRINDVAESEKSNETKMFGDIKFSLHEFADPNVKPVGGFVPASLPYYFFKEAEGGRALAPFSPRLRASSHID